MNLEAFNKIMQMPVTELLQSNWSIGVFSLITLLALYCIGVHYCRKVTEDLMMGNYQEYPHSVGYNLAASDKWIVFIVFLFVPIWLPVFLFLRGLHFIIVTFVDKFLKPAQDK